MIWRNLLLLLPGRLDLGHPFGAQALDQGQAAGALVHHLQGFQPELLDDPPGHFRTDALDQSGGQVAFDAQYRGGGQAFGILHPDLEPVFGMPFIDALDFQDLSRGDGQEAPHHRDQIPLPFDFDAGNGKAALRVAVSNAFHVTFQGYGVAGSGTGKEGHRSDPFSGPRTGGYPAPGSPARFPGP